MRTLDLLEIPPLVPIRGGLLANATVYDSPNNEFLHQTGIVQRSTCEVPQQAPYDCFTNIPIPDAPKDPHGLFSSETTTFSLYFGVDCWLQPNENDQEFMQRAREGLIAGESAGIEVIGQDLLNLITDTETAIGIVDAIGKAERYAGNKWGHLPTLFMDREVATDAIAAHVAFPGLDWTLTTGQGTPIVNAGGFSAQSAIWVTGPVSLMRGPINVYRAVHPTLNREMAIAERSYSLWIDCGGLKVTITAAAQQNQDPPPGTPLALTIGTIPSSPVGHGTDVTVQIHSNYAPPAEVILYAADAPAGPWTSLGEMTEITSHEYVSNYETGSLGGQTKYLKASVGSTSSSVIAVDIT